jgi:hypothetical protein
MRYSKYLEKEMRFGRLHIIEVDEDSKVKDDKDVPPSQWKYWCRCSCLNATITTVKRTKLVSGLTKSCGCLQKETASTTNSKVNSIEDCGEYIKIFFFNREHGCTLVDKEDYIKVKDYCWCRTVGIGGVFYSIANAKGKHYSSSVYMHSIILPTKEGIIPEHKDGDGLNNRKLNMRTASSSQNSMNTKVSKRNTSGVKGISWNIKQNKWESCLSVGGKRVLRKLFKNKSDAIKARKDAEQRYQKDFSLDASRGVVRE